MAMIEVFWPKFEKIAPTQTHKIPVRGLPTVPDLLKCRMMAPWGQLIV